MSNDSETIMIARLAQTPANSIAAYIIYRNVDADEGIVADVLRIYELVSTQTRVLESDAGPVQKQEELRSFKFYLDDYFTDFDTTINSESLLYVRELSPSEEIYVNYVKAINDYRVAKVEKKQKELQTKLASKQEQNRAVTNISKRPKKKR